MAPPRIDPDFVTDDELITGEAVALHLRPASFVVRGAGAVIDFAVSAVIAIGALVLLSSSAFSLSIDQAALQAITIALLVFVTIVVPAGVETLTHGKSVGKAVMGTRIVRDDGGAIGFRHALIRALTGFLEIFLTLGGLAVLVALLNSRAKRLGDLLAGTYSQGERVGRVLDPLFKVPANLAEWAGAADVTRLPDRLSLRVSAFLRQAGAMVPATRARLAAELQAEASAYVDRVPDGPPEAFLLAITAIRRDREAVGHALERERMTALAPVLGALPHGFPDRT